MMTKTRLCYAIVIDIKPYTPDEMERYEMDEFVELLIPMIPGELRHDLSGIAVVQDGELWLNFKHLEMRDKAAAIFRNNDSTISLTLRAMAAAKREISARITENEDDLPF